MQLSLFADKPHPHQLSLFKDREVAGSHQDAATAEAMLRKVQDHGAAVLEDIARQAVERLLTSGNLPTAASLFDQVELARLTAALASTLAGGEVLGRAKVALTESSHESFGDGAEFDLDDAHSIPHAGGHGITDTAIDDGWEYFSDQPSLRKFADAEPLPPLHPEAALKWFRDLHVGEPPEALPGEARREAFKLAVTTDVELLGRVKDAIEKRIAGTASLRPSGKLAVEQILFDAGVSPLRKNYSDTVFRTSTMSAYTKGMTEQIKDQAEMLPAWEYVGIRDGRQRPSHEVHFGKLYPAHADFAEVRDSVAGKFDSFNCRCVPRPVSKFELKRLQRDGRRVENWS